MHVPRSELPSVLRGFRRALCRGGIVGLNLQVGRESEVVSYGEDRRFFEYYRNRREIVGLLRRAGFDVVDSDYGETTRNTHGMDLVLKWATVFGRLPVRGVHTRPTGNRP